MFKKRNKLTKKHTSTRAYYKVQALNQREGTSTLHEDSDKGPMCQN